LPRGTPSSARVYLRTPSCSLKRSASQSRWNFRSPNRKTPSMNATGSRRSIEPICRRLCQPALPIERPHHSVPVAYQVRGFNASTTSRANAIAITLDSFVVRVRAPYWWPELHEAPLAFVRMRSIALPTSSSSCLAAARRARSRAAAAVTEPLRACSVRISRTSSWVAMSLNVVASHPKSLFAGIS
jgi:hypothetical protein